MILYIIHTHTIIATFFRFYRVCCWRVCALAYLRVFSFVMATSFWQARPRQHIQGSTSDGKSSVGAATPALTYKERQAQENIDATENSIAWNALFVRPDTVVKAVAQQRGIAQRDVIETDDGHVHGSNSAVRLALGEAQIVADTKLIMEREGVNLDALKNASCGGVPVLRSDTTILVKNLPFSCNISGVRSMFSQHGVLGRVVLPPSRAVALVEYIRPVDARRAFKALAYRRLKRVPLYLEWAPMGTFHQRPSCGDASHKHDHDTSFASTGLIAAGGAVTRETVASAELTDGHTVNESCIYVKNIAFETSEDALYAHIAAAFGYKGPSSRKIGAQACYELARRGGPAKAAIRRVSIPRRASLRARSTSDIRGAKPDGSFSAGFGFVEFRSRADAQQCLKRLQGPPPFCMFLFWFKDIPDNLHRHK